MPRQELEQQGLPVTVQAAEVDGKTFFRVALSGFRNWPGAVAFKDGIADSSAFPPHGR